MRKLALLSVLFAGCTDSQKHDSEIRAYYTKHNEWYSKVEPFYNSQLEVGRKVMSLSTPMLQMKKDMYQLLQQGRIDEYNQLAKQYNKNAEIMQAFSKEMMYWDSCIASIPKR